MGDGVQVRLEAISKREPLNLGAIADLAEAGASFPDVRLPVTIVSIEERDWLVERLSTALDRLKRVTELVYCGGYGEDDPEGAQYSRDLYDAIGAARAVLAGEK